MNSQTKLFQTGNFNFKLNHLIIIGVLVLAFSTSFLIRTQSADYGFELNEFDPFFNFRATEYLIQNGFSEYSQWDDNKSWHPYGRDVSATSQVMLHVTAAITYQIFGGNSSLYDFTILFPVVIGSLTVIVIFGLVRLFGGTTAGLIASMLFAISLPIILRGGLGWFKSEPLGILYGLLGLYLFLSAIKSENKKIVLSKIIFGAIILSFAMNSWGGNQFFIMPLGLFILALPFVRKDHKFLLWTVPLFVGLFILISSMFERPGLSFVYTLGGFALLIPTIILIGSIFIQKLSKEKNKIRNGLILLIIIIVIGSSLIFISNEYLPLTSFRYLNAINPFLTTTDPLTDSVAEHATTNIETSFYLHSILMVFAGLGAWIILSNKLAKTEFVLKNDMKVFVLILGITSVYVSSAFIRLEVFASIALIILASVGLSLLTKEIFNMITTGKKSYLVKIPYVTIIVILFVIPLTLPAGGSWIDSVDFPATILSGGSANPASPDWLETMEWIKMNTPKDAVIASWWDYGYWIQTLAERATLADNSTVNDTLIQNIAKMLLSSPDRGWEMLQEMDADYLVVFVAGQKLEVTHEGEHLVILNRGGDESKKFWFVKIAEVPLEKFFEYDGITANDYFWNETLLGQVIPYSTLLYYNEQTSDQLDHWEPGFIPIEMQVIKYDSDTDPLKLVYASSSFYDNESEFLTGVFVYKINKNYIINNSE